MADLLPSQGSILPASTPREPKWPLSSSLVDANNSLLLISVSLPVGGHAGGEHGLECGEYVVRELREGGGEVSAAASSTDGRLS